MDDTADTAKGVQSSRVLYLREHNSNTNYLVDTGAAMSVVPPRDVDVKHR